MSLLTVKQDRHLCSIRLKQKHSRTRRLRIFSEYCRIEPVDEKVRQQLVPTVNAAVSQSDVLQRIIDDLSITVHDCDLKMVDLYHFAGNNPKLPAHRGYKIYKKLAELVQERAKAKAQIQAIKSAMTYEYVPYNPRTELYNELDKM